MKRFWLTLGLLAMTRVAAARPLAPPVLDEDDEDDRVIGNPERAIEEDFWGMIARPNYAAYLRALRIANDERNKNHLQTAEVRLQEAISLEPAEAEAHYRLGVLYSDMKRWADCGTALGEVRKLAPDYPDPEFPFKAGFCLSLAGRLEDSIEEYRRYQPAEVDKLLVKHWNMGDSYMALGRLDDAIASYRLALASNDFRAMPHFALGVALDRDEQLSAGKDEIAQGLRRNPDLSEFESGTIYFLPPEEKSYYLGFIHEERQYRALAIAHWRYFLTKQPSGPWSRRAHDHLEALEKSPGPTDKELQVDGSQAADRAALLKGITAGMPVLARCLAGEPTAVIRVDVMRSSTGGSRFLANGHGGPVDASAKATTCVSSAAAKLALPKLKSGAQTLVFPVVSP